MAKSFHLLQSALFLLCVLTLRETNQQATTPAPGLVGDACTGPPSQGKCTAHANCDVNNTCQCDPNYSKKSDRNCGANVGQPCNHPKGCVDHARCNNLPSTTTPVSTAAVGPTQAVIASPADTDQQSGNSSQAKKRDTSITCVCEEDFYSEIDTCHKRLPVGTHCQVQQSNLDHCTKNAVCNSTVAIPPICWCTESYYSNDTGHCLSRIPPGHPCAHTANGENNCVAGARCYENDTCHCVLYQFKPSQNGDTCTKIQQPGENCTLPTDCGENAHCHTDGNCKCDNDFFYNSDEKHCQLRKPLGATCTKKEECVENAKCNITCTCDDNYYDHNQRCNRRLQLNHECDSTIPNQCLKYGDCVHGLCKCDQNSYSDGIDCRPSKSFDVDCDLDISDPRQCVSNTSCVFLSDKPKCGCDIHHFFNGNHCVRRALAGESCPYVGTSSVGLHMTNEEFEKQCVENARCNGIFEVCECKPNYYDRNGRCPRRIQADGICDPWIDNPHQCVESHQCLYGRCVQHHQ